MSEHFCGGGLKPLLYLAGVFRSNAAHPESDPGAAAQVNRQRSKCKPKFDQVSELGVILIVFVHPCAAITSRIFAIAMRIQNLTKNGRLSRLSLIFVTVFTG